GAWLSNAWNRWLRRRGNERGQWRTGDRFHRRHRRQAPFSRGILRPDHFRFDERDLSNNESIAKERPKFHPQLETLGFKKIAAWSARLLRNRDAIEHQPAPRSDTDLPQPQWRVET